MWIKPSKYFSYDISTFRANSVLQIDSIVKRIK